jgi:hypothetical protein
MTTKAHYRIRRHSTNAQPVYVGFPFKWKFFALLVCDVMNAFSAWPWIAHSVEEVQEIQE